DLAEVVAQRHRVRIPTPEDQAPVAFEPRHDHKAELRTVEVLRQVAIERRRDQPAVPPIGPPVIRTDEVADGAGTGPAHLRAAMAAAVEKRVYAAVVVANHHARRAAEVPANEIAWCRDLRLVGEEHPAAIEDTLQLSTKNLVLDEDVAADQTALH